MSPGYLGDEALTAKHFESIDGIRRFHTGDLARRSASGRLTVMGRADAQVKVRGHRLQLEEVEAALARQQDVSGAAAVVRFNARGDARLVAYVTMTPGSQLDAGRLRTSLAASLPPHAVPSAIVGVDAFPLTPHGKVDREQLVRTEPVVAASSELERNPSETEELLRDTWCAAFEHNGIGLDEGFLALGGDSLTAAVIAAELRELFGVELGLREFAADPTVAELAASIEERRGIPVIEPEPPLERAHRGGPVRLSFSQAAMWVSVHDKAAGFNIAVPYQLSGSLDVAALRDCLEQIVRRHEILRTVFVERDGVTVQLGQAPQLELAHDDLRAERDPLAAAERIVARDAAIPFDVGSLPPLSMRLLRVSDREHRLLLVSHHLICDALSWRVFFDELALLYEARVSGRASPLPPEPPLQYADFAIWEETVARPGSARWQSDLAWWAARFESPPPTLRLPFSLDSPEPVGRSTSVIESRFAKTLSEQLDTIAREAGATSFMGRLAAFAALLALRTGVDDFVLDTYVTARRHAALRHMIGPLINRVLLRIRFSGELTFNGWLAEVREAVLETMAHTTITFGELWRELHRQGIQRPTVRTKFEAHYRVPSKRFGDLQLEALTRHYVEPWGFTLGIECDEGADRWRAVCDPGEYDVTVVERFLGDLEKLVRAACTQPDRPLRELEAGLVVGVDALG
jgi:acyl carrier protein